METIDLGPFISWTGSPYAIFWVYTPKGNYKVMGMSYDVRNWVEKNIPEGVYHYTYWKNGRSRGGWMTTPGLKLWFEKKFHNGQWRWCVSMMNKDNGLYLEDCHSFRRMPHKWLPLFDKAKNVNKQQPVTLNNPNFHFEK